MTIETLHQPNYNSTMLGVVRGAADHYGIALSTPMLYGLSGHAWLINIHPQLCPSGPYCYDCTPNCELLAGAGLATERLGFYGPDQGDTPRAEVEAKLRAEIDNGAACYLVNMEYQLLLGYDETGFITAQPWAPCVDFPPKHLTFDTWAELGADIHLAFAVLRPVPAQPLAESVAASLNYAARIWSDPPATGHYGFGPNAYDFWLQAVRDGHGASHGNWWNGTVYAECRQNAAAYLRELATLYPTAAPLATELAEGYDQVHGWLVQAADKDLAVEPKIEVLTLAAARERELAPALLDLDLG